MWRVYSALLIAIECAIGNTPPLHKQSAPFSLNMVLLKWNYPVGEMAVSDWFPSKNVVIIHVACVNQTFFIFFCNSIDEQLKYGDRDVFS